MLRIYKNVSLSQIFIILNKVKNNLTHRSTMRSSGINVLICNKTNIFILRRFSNNKYFKKIIISRTKSLICLAVEIIGKVIKIYFFT